MAASALDAVLEHPAVWRGSECARVAPALPSGYTELDLELPGGGWPAGALTEIYTERAGVGELKLLMPALARLTRTGSWVTLIAPPHVPYAPALAAHGVELERLLLVQGEAAEDRLWACEQALGAACSGAAVLWQDHIQERALRRLKLAAENSGALLFLFRTARVAPAPAALRLHVSRLDHLTCVRILKRRGGGLQRPITLDLHGTLVSRTRTVRAGRATEREPAVTLA
jgi:hypothetical protein